MCGAAVMGVLRAGGASGQKQAGRSKQVGAWHCWYGRSDVRIEGTSSWWRSVRRQLDGAMELAPGVHGLLGLHAVQLWDAAAADWGAVPSGYLVAGRLAAKNATGIG